MAQSQLFLDILATFCEGYKRVVCKRNEDTANDKNNKGKLIKHLYFTNFAH